MKLNLKTIDEFLIKNNSELNLKYNEIKNINLEWIGGFTPKQIKRISDKLNEILKLKNEIIKLKLAKENLNLTLNEKIAILKKEEMIQLDSDQNLPVKKRVGRPKGSTKKIVEVKKTGEIKKI